MVLDYELCGTCIMTSMELVELFVAMKIYLDHISSYICECSEIIYTVCLFKCRD